MTYNTNKNKYDEAVPPLQYFDTLTQLQSKKERAITVRSLGVMAVSFISVFVITFTAVTWPLVPGQTSYYLKKMINGQDKQAYASLKPAVFDKNLDTDKDGFPDLQELEAGYDPYNADPVKIDTDNDGIKDDIEVNFYGTDPTRADTDSDGYDDLNEILNGYSALQPADFDKWLAARTQATLIIPSLDVKLPVVWNENLAKMSDDLERGVVKYKGTANPGEGNTVIVAHSSDYVWHNNKFATAFAHLDSLKKGQPIYIDYAGTRYVYQTGSQRITNPKDTSDYAASNNKSLTLGTCWPIGFSWNRLYLKANLVDRQPIK